ncbi:RNA polymerase-binding transcription factor [Candidatus Aerophobetes bacterium]|uniref:RNA polymerase-binding transcription factor n=1 Tax=Aerophobetes bacterium TaxID=2030807 RepID=A0A2A4X2U9_UNCAE|nr:MAG: RNA polymerase-binding transcription factor [Candidatus Aerophobetes bacterium]
MTLNKKELIQIKEKLEKMQKEISGVVKNVSLDIKVDEGAKSFSQHPSDMGTDNFNQKISMELSEKNQAILKSIGRALEKIEEGSYGLCDMTQKVISKKRLEATPYAIYTIESQEILEKEAME